MKRIISFAVVLLFCLSTFVTVALAADMGSKLSVNAGQSRTITMYGLQRAAIANPDVADVVVVSSDELVLVGKATGTTTLIVWSQVGRRTYVVEVGSNDAGAANEIRRILGYPDIRVSLVNFNVDGKTKTRTVILEGTVNDQYQRLRAEKIAAAYGDKVVNLLEIARPVQIKLEAVIVEINRQKTQELGIKFFSQTGTASSPGVFYAGQSQLNTVNEGKVLSSVTSINPVTQLGSLGSYNDINAQLSLLVKNGYARILSQPNVVTLSGDKANILVGGQIPVPVSNQAGQISIEWKDYGIRLDISPEASLDGIISSKIKAEVSSLDWNSTAKIDLGNKLIIPPMKMRKAETSIALGSGQTMAIGGLIAAETTKDVIKVPFLGDLPVLGQLFRSNSFTKGETELIVLVTPTILDANSLVPKISEELKGVMTPDKDKPKPPPTQNK